MANVDKMYTYLRGFLVGANMTESLKALGFARQQHSLQTRKAHSLVHYSPSYHS